MMQSLRIVFYFFVLAVASSCTLAPTKIYSTQDIDLKYLNSALEEPIHVTADTVILDARPPFEFAMAHHPQAVNMQWSDFADVRGPYPGLLIGDLNSAARRLALLGISPATDIIVVGLGGKGNGEEGRLAWTLFYMGLTRVQVAQADRLGSRYTNILPPPKANSKVWSVEPRTSVLATKKEVMAAAVSRHSDRLHLIDVRSKNEYFSKNKKLEYEYPDLRAIHIEWHEFYSLDGRPNRAMRGQLQSIGVQPEDRVIVISNNGLRSGAVTFALLALGYKNAANFAGGYAELLSQNSK